MSTATSSSHWQPSLVRVLGFALLSSLATFALTSSLYPFFALPSLPEMGLNPRPEVVKLHEDASFQFYTRNSSVLFACLGAVLGVMLGLVTTPRRRWAAALSGGIGGAALGALGGFGAGVLLNRMLWLSESESLVWSFGIHFVAWAPAIGGAVWGVAWQQVGMVKALALGLGGLLSAVFVVAGYCLLASIFFHDSNLTFVYPDQRWVQIFWSLLFPLEIGFAIMLTSRLSVGRPA